MKTQLTFSEVCNFIKEDNPKQPQLMEDVDKLLGFALILAPFVLFPSPLAVAPALGLLSVKGELTGIGKKLYEKLTRKNDKDALAKQKRMEAAYGLVCFTAFFDALDAQAPEIFGYIGFQNSDKVTLVEEAIEKLSARRECNSQQDEQAEGRLGSLRVGLPHPVDSFEQQRQQLLPLYQELTKGFLSFLEWLPLWGLTSEEVRGKVIAVTQELPRKALEHFDAQYYLLAVKYEEFFVWSNLQEHMKTRAALKKQMSAYLKKHIALISAEQKSIDLGFAKLADAVAAIPERVAARQADKVFEELGKSYISTINEPVFKDKSVEADGQPSLTYPKKSAIFVPQSFKAIHYKSNVQLEDEATWSAVPSRNDLGAFLLSYLSSPYSALAPLVILGHPGSGKSLLTHMLSARLISPLHAPIRVELRDINADNEIDDQIQQQIRKDTGRQVDWTDLSDNLGDRPALVLLDGYDELLQASGKVFSGYILKVQQFQKREMSIRNNRPVRAIITSRITLIDKAEMAEGATIVRLEEFDEEKRNKWVSIWNAANQQYFKQTGNEPFELPKEDKNIIPLAEQPLLLLMLALYDSEGNQLRKSKGLDQTWLYYSLIRRFVERERMKGEQFQSLKQKERADEIEKDMERLGLAALGMFNRRSLYIHADQLNADLKFFRLERAVQDSTGIKMSQADLLLGSFFFVHKAKSTRGDSGKAAAGGGAAPAAEGERVEPHDEAEAAFEFLHNTFGEFLAADFILRKVLFETSKLSQLDSSPELKSVLLSILENPNGLPESWYASLMYTPLYSRPVILDMMREWLRHRLSAASRDHGDFLAGLDIIVPNEVERLLVCNRLPSVMTENNKTSFDDLPLIGHLATYSLNLILLRTVLSPDGYTFNEEAIIPFGENQIVPLKDSVRAWDRLTHLWRSWFSLESLNELTAILTARRDGAKVLLGAKQSFTTSASNDRLESILNVGLALADNITSGLAGLLMYSPFADTNALDLDEVEGRLDSERIDLKLEVALKRLGDELSRQTPPSHESDGRTVAGELLDDCIRLFTQTARPNHAIFPTLVQHAKEVVARGEDRIGLVYELLGHSVYQQLYVAMPAAVLDLIRLLKEDRYGAEYRRGGDIYHLTRGILDREDPQYLLEKMPELVIETIASLRGETEPRHFLRWLLEEKFLSGSLARIPSESAVKLLRLAEVAGYHQFAAGFAKNFLQHKFIANEDYGVFSKASTEFIRLARRYIDASKLNQVAEAHFTQATRTAESFFNSPEATVDLFLLIRQLGLFYVIRSEPTTFLRYIVRPEFLAHVSSEGVAGVIRLARETGETGSLSGWYGVCRDEPEARDWTPRFTAEVLSLAEEFSDDEFLRRFFTVKTERDADAGPGGGDSHVGFYEGKIEVDLGSLPLDAARHVYRLAEKFDAAPAVEKVRRLAALK